MKLLKNELWAGVISAAHDSVRVQVDEQVDLQVIEQVCRLVTWPVQLAVSWGVGDEIEGEMK